VAAFARFARAAARLKRREHDVADVDRRHLLAAGDYLAGELVTEHEGWFERRVAVND